MLLIYTPSITPRLRYTCTLILKTILGVEFELTADPETFRRYGEAKISYTRQPLSDEIFFQSSALLFEAGVKPQRDLPDDPFALSFFLASRYEEYLPFQQDQYGRFPATQSYAYRQGWLQIPIVHHWAKQIREKVADRYPAFSFPEKKYSFQPTLDIDNAYAFYGKNGLRTLGGYARALLKSDREDFSKRKKVLSGKEKDPYDTYAFQDVLHKKYRVKPIYFFLLADWAEYDKNLPHTSPAMQSLVKSISANAETGIHPSFASNLHPEKILKEKKRLSAITGKEVTKSRQHFLKLRFPETYRHLLAAGITDDYTLGFADQTGFRSGLCTAHNWYDLTREEETNLTLHPFAVMDGTLNNYLKLSPEEAIEKTSQIIAEIKKVNGQFISIWHNETLSDWKEWKGWKEVYEQVIRKAV